MKIVISILYISLGDFENSDDFISIYMRRHPKKSRQRQIWCFYCPNVNSLSFRKNPAACLDFIMLFVDFQLGLGFSDMCDEKSPISMNYPWSVSAEVDEITANTMPNGWIKFRPHSFSLPNHPGIIPDHSSFERSLQRVVPYNENH